ncbi:protein mlo2-like isoform X2 [Cucumis melo var. makuwa]|uniref:Protein mlo2-like isoform X2 n=1 Tax=Cucumis melo var. makuwa TaxID=1194695 RepID=A0A5A7SYA0_CUCMM|nr:protein mlo2-like isoform X2 [Cucumis melo var. makuwa]
MAGKGEGPAIGIDLGTDDLMVQYEGCKDWFHPSCMGMTIEEAKKLDHFLCSDCSSENEAKRSLNAFSVSPSGEAKNNNIFGPIPIELGTIPLLQTLDLSNNRFSCPIPTSFAQLNGLHYLLNKYLDVVFLKLDCNQDNKPLAKEIGIKVVPTFKILKDKKVVKEVTGAKFDDLVHVIDTVRSS